MIVEFLKIGLIELNFKHKKMLMFSLLMPLSQLPKIVRHSSKSLRILKQVHHWKSLSPQSRQVKVGISGNNATPWSYLIIMKNISMEICYTKSSVEVKDRTSCKIKHVEFYISKAWMTVLVKIIMISRNILPRVTLQLIRKRHPTINDWFINKASPLYLIDS